MSKKIARGLFSSLFVLIAAVILYFVCTIFVFKISLSNDASAVLEIHAGDNSRDIANFLVSRNIISYRLPFIIWARLLRIDRSMKAGEYALTPQQTINDLCQQIYQGRVIQYQIRFLEGWTFKQMRVTLDAHPKLQHLSRGKTPAWIMAQLADANVNAAKASDAQENDTQENDTQENDTQENDTQENDTQENDIKENPEGRFFPSTYNFPAKSTDLRLLQKAYRKMTVLLQTLWNRRAADLPYKNSYQALIMASLIEEEAAKASERKLIASVLVNRLRENMRLQVDPTVMYGLHMPYGQRLLSSDLKIDTPYNTYRHKGLPPTPIAMPSKASLQAALHPAQTDYLYYVSKKTGFHQFSKTYAEHKEAISQYLRPLTADTDMK